MSNYLVNRTSTPSGFHVCDTNLLSQIKRALRKYYACEADDAYTPKRNLLKFTEYSKRGTLEILDLGHKSFSKKLKKYPVYFIVFFFYFTWNENRSREFHLQLTICYHKISFWKHLTVFFRKTLVLIVLLN